MRSLVFRTPIFNPRVLQASALVIDLYVVTHVDYCGPLSGRLGAMYQNLPEKAIGVSRTLII